MRHLVILAAVASLTGCATSPSTMDAGWSHVSHPKLGRPFGPSSEEDTLDTLGLRARWDRGKCFAEMGLGYQIRDGGFYGDDFIFQSRVGVRLFDAD
jgi:hypothetical protein